MPETLTWSVVGAVHALWLAARAHGVGLGWVSILEPARVRDILAVPETWSLVAYLCLGYPEEEHLDPELDRAGWQRRTSDFERVVLRR
jgi:5,6-dimethylbenzimidazole synthase